MNNMIHSKKKRFKIGLRNKFLSLFTLILLIPAISICTCGIIVSIMKQDIEQSSVTELQYIDDVVYERVMDIQHTINVIKASSEVQEALSTGDGDITQFESVIEKHINNTHEIESVIFITETGKALTYSSNAMNIDYIKLQVLYNIRSGNQHSLNWFSGNEKNAEIGFAKDVVVAGTLCKYGNHTNADKQTAKMYVCIAKDVFSNVLKNASKGERLFVLDKNGTLLSNNEKDFWFDQIATSISLMERVYESDSDVVSYENGTSKFVFSCYTSSTSELKYVKMCDSDVFYNGIYKSLSTLVLIIVLILAIICIIYISFERTIIKPLRNLTKEMKSFGNEALHNEMLVPSDDEIGNVVKGFNKMRKRICEMIDEAKAEERKKNDIELEALQYQINPHFIYNTLGAIRITAMEHKEEDIADALLLLNKILKSVFSNANKYSTCKEESEMLKDYVKLLQLRFNNKIHMTTKISEDVANVMVPTMLLQPIIENSIFHGLSQKMNEVNFVAHILMNFEMQGDDLIIEVFDNGEGMTPEKIDSIFSDDSENGRGIGLSNVDKRIKLLYGPEYGIRIDSKVNVYTNVSIKLKKI